nr:acyltransferase family protein [Rhizomicrobium palustre]
MGSGASHLSAGHQKYRPDVDGLRALAVGLVVIYHAFNNKLTGGFVGVDVFFVISGFLISSIIFSEIEDKDFSFARFYARRIKRIFPSLIAMLVACYALGAAIMLTDEFQNLCKYIAGSAGFVANIVLLNNTGYFNSDSQFNPLLHMWSLGIEEQFYFIWPITLCLVYRYNIPFKYILIGGFALSFAANIYMVHHNVTADFYLPYTRFFELVIGAAIAYFTILHRGFLNGAGSALGARVHRTIENPAFSNVLSLAGITLIMAAALFLNGESKFPGWWALLPTFGGACIIVAGTKAWFNRVVLANPVTVFIGLLSYPIYLWHWPLLAFLRITNNSPSINQRIFAVLMSVLISWLVYKFIERPLRFGKSRWIVPALCLATFSLAAAGLVIANDSHFILRGNMKDLAQLKWVESEPNCYSALGLSKEAKSDTIFCHLAKPGSKEVVAVLGDSMANSLYPGLRDALASKGIGVANYGAGTCEPFRHLYGDFTWNKDCDVINEHIYANVATDPRIKTVILSFAHWDIQNMYFDARRTPLPIEEKFRRVSAIAKADIAFLEAHGKKVIVSYDGPNIGRSPRLCLTSGMRCSVKRETVESGNRGYLTFWDGLLGERADICVFRQTPYLRQNGSYPMRKNGELLYRDDHHLSFDGSALIGRALVESHCFAS